MSFGEHRILVRPRESYDQRLLSADLTIDPEPASLRWLHDVFGNAVAVARFAGKADRLMVEAHPKVEHLPSDAAANALETYAQAYPFTYSAEDMPDLLRSIERDYPDRNREVDAWARQFLDSSGPTPTLVLLRTITERIKADLSYQPREEKGIQTPLETLRRGSGTCRDYAVLMMEAVRALGLAARFVSGYLYSPDRKDQRVGGHTTHAWVRVFLPGSGWLEFDPTNGICGNRGLIRVAITRDPTQATPLSGTWTGMRNSQLDMEVDVKIRHCESDAADAGEKSRTPAHAGGDPC